MSWMDAGDVRKARGGKATGKGRGKGGLSAEDAKKIAKTDPDYKSVDKKQRKWEKKAGENTDKRRGW